jgi:hypothetical protein
MSNEKKGVVLSQTQNEGPGLFSRLMAGSVVRFGPPGAFPSALSAAKWPAGSNASNSFNRLLGRVNTVVNNRAMRVFGELSYTASMKAVKAVSSIV